MLSSVRNKNVPLYRGKGNGFRCVLEPAPPAATAAAMPAQSRSLAAATKDAPFMNTLGMRFVPVAATKVFFSIWETRVQDYAAYAEVNRRMTHG